MAGYPGCPAVGSEPLPGRLPWVTLPHMWPQRLQKWLGFFLFVSVFGTLGLATLRSVFSPFGTDEGNNLEVVDNVARGVGYASYGNRQLDAWWSARKTYAQLLAGQVTVAELPKPWFFEPRVTTGPTLLLPLAFVWKLFPGNVVLLRASCAVFLILALWAFWRVSAPPQRWLTFSLAASMVAAYRFGPGAVLGDLAAVAFFSWACVVLEKRSPLVAGLLFGLAFHAKVITLAGLAAVLLTLVGASLLRGNKPWRNLWRVVAGFCIPLAAFEVYRWWTLGSLSAYLEYWQENLDFVNWRTGFSREGRLFEKLRFLQLYGPGLPLGLAALALLARNVYLSVVVLRNRGWRALAEIFETAPVFLTAGGLPIVLVWLFYTEQAGPRQMLPGAILLFAGLALLRGVMPQDLEEKTRRRWSLPLLDAMILVLTVVGVGRWARHFWVARDASALLGEQLEAARALRASGAKSISAIASPYEPFPFLSGLRVSPCPASHQALVLTRRAENATGKRRDDFRDLCQDVVYEGSEVFICLLAAPENPFDLTSLEVGDWGPKNVPLRQVVQGRGGHRLAFWFRLASPAQERPRLVVLVDGKPASLVTWSSAGDWFSAGIGFEVLAEPGRHLVELFEPCSGKRRSLGWVAIEDER